MELRVFNDSAPSGVLTVPPIPIRRRMFGPLTLMRRWRTAAFGASIYVFSLFLLYENFSHRWNAFALGVDIPRRRLPLFRRSGGLFACGNRLPGAADCGRQLVRIRQHGDSSFRLAGGRRYSRACTQRDDFVELGDPRGSHARSRRGSPLDHRKPHVAAENRMARARAHNAAFAGLTPLLRQFPGPCRGTRAQSFGARGHMQNLRQGPSAVEPVERDHAGCGAMAVVCDSLSALCGELAACGSPISAHPCLAGYSRDAQANLLQRMLDRRIWGFWFWENLWGNFDPNPDPIRRDNIMVSGYVAEIVGIFETLTGDRRFDLPGGLDLSMERQEGFAYDYTGLIDALMYNFQRYDYRWMPCEPNLIYFPAISRASPQSNSTIACAERTGGSKSASVSNARLRMSSRTRMGGSSALHSIGSVCALPH